jgi:hypothetical protein
MWRCAKCAETLEDQYGACWSCGSLRPKENLPVLHERSNSYEDEPPDRSAAPRTPFREWGVPVLIGVLSFANAVSHGNRHPNMWAAGAVMVAGAFFLIGIAGLFIAHNSSRPIFSIWMFRSMLTYFIGALLGGG